MLEMLGAEKTEIVVVKHIKLRKVLKCVTILLGEKIQLIYNLVTTKIITHGVFFILHFHRLVGSEECK